MFIVFLHIHYALVATCTCVWALLMDYHRVLCVDIHTVLDRTDMYMCTSVQELHWTQFVISLHKYLCWRLTYQDGNGTETMCVHIQGIVL